VALLVPRELVPAELDTTEPHATEGEVR
jgi:hypothetical protein